VNRIGLGLFGLGIALALFGVFMALGGRVHVKETVEPRIVGDGALYETTPAALDAGLYNVGLRYSRLVTGSLDGRLVGHYGGEAFTISSPELDGLQVRGRLPSYKPTESRSKARRKQTRDTIEVPTPGDYSFEIEIPEGPRQHLAVEIRKTLMDPAMPLGLAALFLFVGAIISPSVRAFIKQQLDKRRG